MIYSNMVQRGTISKTLVNGITEMIDYELLVSTPGIKEPDSDFMWAQRFRAPVGVSFVGTDVYINLFLPEGSEESKDKNLFLNRVSAKFQDGLWQARRNLNRLSGMYGSSLQMAVNTFRSMFLDYSFIQNGRYFAHFIFSRADLQQISVALVSFADSVEDLRVEYLRKLDADSTLFRGDASLDDVSAVTLGFGKEAGLDGDSVQKGINFVMASFIDQGIKTICKVSENKLPQFFKATDVQSIKDDVVFCKTSNELLIALISELMSNFIVIYGIYGVASDNSANVVFTLPTQQTTAFLRAMQSISSDDGSSEISILEVEQVD